MRTLIGVFHAYKFPVYNMLVYFVFLYLDTGFHCHLIRVHVRAGIWDLVYMVEAGDVAAIIITPASLDACPTGGGNRDTTNERRLGGLQGPWA